MLREGFGHSGSGQFSGWSLSWEGSPPQGLFEAGRGGGFIFVWREDRRGGVPLGRRRSSLLCKEDNKISLNISQVYSQLIKCSVKIAGMKMKPVQNIVLVAVKKSNQKNPRLLL